MTTLVPMKVQIWAGDVLVAETVDAGLFGRVFAHILDPLASQRCPLCAKTPAAHCCLNTRGQPK